MGEDVLAGLGLRSLLFRSKSLFSDLELLALVNLLKKPLWANRSRRSLQKSDCLIVILLCECDQRLSNVNIVLHNRKKKHTLSATAWWSHLCLPPPLPLQPFWCPPSSLPSSPHMGGEGCSSKGGVEKPDVGEATPHPQFHQLYQHRRLQATTSWWFSIKGQL